MNKRLLLLLGLSALFLVACDTLPDEDASINERLVLIADLNPGDTGLQTIRLSRPIEIGDEMIWANCHFSGAEITLWNEEGDTLLVPEIAEDCCYGFDRALFPLVPGDSVSLCVLASWSGKHVEGIGTTRIVSPDDFAFTSKPGTWDEELQADTLMFFDEERESGFEEVRAFEIDWLDHPTDNYHYQIELSACCQTDEGWITLPFERRHWLRDDEEMSFQFFNTVNPRSMPAAYAGRQAVSWLWFNMVDDSLRYEPDPDRRMGYYNLAVRRFDERTSAFYYSTHEWGPYEDDQIQWTMEGVNLQGMVGSSASISFKLVIVDD